MKNYVFKSFIATCVAGVAILLTPKTSVAQVDMSLLTEVAGSCQQDVFSSEYHRQLGHQETVNPNDRYTDNHLMNCIQPRYFHSLVLSKLPWIASTPEMIPGYPSAVAVSQIAYVMEPNGGDFLVRPGYGSAIKYSYFLDCLASQDTVSEECRNLRSLGVLYKRYGKLNLFGGDRKHSFYAYMCPSCYVAYNNYPSEKRMVGSFMEWFMTLEPSRRKELMSILGDEQTQRNNRVNMKKEAKRAWEEYKVIRRRIAEEDKEQRRRQLFE